MREIDRIAIEETGPNLFQMMENAGRSLASCAARSVDGSVVVLAGSGGNGGGGICAARHLANRGFVVTVVIGDEGRLAAVPLQQLAVFRRAGGRVRSVDDLGNLDAGLVIDAVIGYSLGGAPRGTARSMIEWAVDTAVPVIALDVPSGVDATSGDAPGVHIRAVRTVTLALPKTGLGTTASGDLSLADIGIPREVHEMAGVSVSPAVFRSGAIVGLVASPG